MSQPAARSARRVSAIVVVALAAGLIIRLWVLVGPLGTLDSDEAIVGLMARHVLRGEIPIFYWGQTYGGSHEAMLAAPLFALFGSSTPLLKMVPMLLDALAAILVWRIGKRLVDEPGAVVAASIFWIWPAAFVWWSTKARGTYWVPLALSLVAVLQVLRLEARLTETPKGDGPSAALTDSLILGLALGIGWWASPQIVYLALPFLLWLLFRAGTRTVKIWPALLTAIAGGLPWILFNLRHHWASFNIPPQPQPNRYSDHLLVFFSTSLPTALGLRIPFSGDWIGGALGPFLYVASLLGLGWILVRKARTIAPLVMAVACYPFLYALSPFSWYSDDPRYLLFLAPALALVIGAWMANMRWGLIAIPGFLTIVGLAVMASGNLGVPVAPDVPVPAHLAGLITALERNGADRVFSDYWVAHRLSFESRERVIATPFEPVRYPAHDRLVRRSHSPRYVFVAGSSLEPRFAKSLVLLGVTFRRTKSGDFIFYSLDRKVLPEEVGLRASL